MRLIRSSDPEAVARDEALRLLAERAVLTLSVCRELLEADATYAKRRARASLWVLLQWIGANLRESARVEPSADDGIDQMVKPSGTEAVVAEIRAGARVCAVRSSCCSPPTLLSRRRETGRD